MKVLCIDSKNLGNDDCPQLEEGEVYEVVGYAKGPTTGYNYYRLNVNYPWAYWDKRFIPCSEIEEEQLEYSKMQIS